MAPKADASRDPYHLVVEEISSSLKRIGEELYDEKLEGLIKDNAASGNLKALQNSLENAEIQITELSKAVEASTSMPEKFGLSAREVKERRETISNFKMETSKYHDRILDLYEAVTLSKKAQSKQFPARNSIVSSYMQDEADSVYDKQQLLMKEQDKDLDHLGEAAKRVGQMGLQIGEELELQTNIIGELEEEVDTTKSRLTVARNMMNKLGRKMGKWQSVVLGALVVLLIILVAVAFG